MPSARLPRWLLPVVLLVVWLGVGATLGPYAGKLGEVATNDQAAFLPRNAESTRVIDAQRAFDQEESVPAIVVWTADSAASSERLRDSQQAAATRALRSLDGSSGVAGRVSPALP
ncbi:hypothetical protein G3I28_39935, partial [Streptomyces sp. SID10116]|nr:hypothetical protein [Streptomyces sp. SID10116]